MTDRPGAGSEIVSEDDDGVWSCSP